MTSIQKFLREFSGRASSKTVQDYTARLEKFAQWQQANDAHEINKKNARAFLVHLHTEGTGAASLSLHKSTLSSYFSWLMESEVIASNPMREIRYGKYHSPAKKNECLITEQEYACLKAKAEPHSYWRGAIIIGWNTALRMGDVANLHFDMIDLENGRIDVTPRKTKRFKKAVEIPILPELAEYLKALTWRHGFVLPGMQREYAEHGSKQLSQQFLRLCESCLIEGKTFHSLRHTLTSRMLNKGLPTSIVSSITGHSLQVLGRYSHARFEDKVGMVMEAMS